MDFLNKALGRQEQPASFSDNLSNEILGLSFYKRVMIFVVLLALGLGLCFLSTFMLLSPTRFAKTYTLGCLLVITSTAFLVGPKKQLQSMFQPERLPAAVLYVASLFGTLYCALSLQSSGLTMLMIILQLAAAVWYGASYVPFAQQCLKSTAKTVLPV
eukprot:TRINITY_DN12823_c0_g1_i1.p1 TRINITY_DN12823_c0_g1~~TRINITY_DN12823_c0_g1_i1.p1  ORF type:complete len:174 (+),score=15.48 TRINITY_DN12823_c0_g1_i1:51-524(+)